MRSYLIGAFIKYTLLALLLISCGPRTGNHIAHHNDPSSCYQVSATSISCNNTTYDLSKPIIDDIEIVTICPDIDRSYPEELLKVNGEYLAFLSSANFKQQRLVTLLEDTLYVTTDGAALQFNIVDGELLCLTLD